MANNKAGTIDVLLRTSFDKGAMTKAQREVGKNMQLMANKAAGASRTITAGIAGSIMPMGALMAGAFAFGGAAAVRFQEQFAAVKKTLDIKGEGQQVEAQFQQIGRQLRNIAKFSPAAISELSQIAAVGGQLGIAASDIVDFTDTIQKLTVATNMSAEDAAMSLARLQKITGLAASDIDNLGSVIVKLGNNFATTESEIVTAATQIATATAGIKTEFNNAAADAVGWATALRAVGQQAQAGSTAIIRLTQVVKRLVQTGGTQLEDLVSITGMSVQAFQDLFDIDPSKALAVFIESLGKIESQGKDAIAVLDEIGLGQVRTTRAIMALSRAEGEGGMSLIAEALSMANQEFIENNALMTEAERRYETVISQFKILKNIVNEAAISYGEKFLPRINAITQGLADMLTAMTQFDKIESVTKRIGGVMTTLALLFVPITVGVRAITKETLEYAAALNLARTGVTGLDAAEQAMLFKRTKGGPQGLLFRSGSLKSSIRKPKPTTSLPVDIAAGGTGTIVQAQSRMSDSFLQTNKALKQVAGTSIRARLKFLRMNGAFKDGGLFLENFNKKIDSHNKKSKGLTRAMGNMITKTNALKGGMMGLATATKALGAAFGALAKSVGRMMGWMAMFTLVFNLIERIGAKKRSLDEFAQGIDGVGNSISELAEAERKRDALLKKRGETTDIKVIEFIDESLANIDKGIAGLESQIDTDAGGILATLIFGQRGMFGKNIEKNMEKAMEKAGMKDTQAFKDSIFGAMSGVVTDIHTGKVPTVGDVIDALADASTGDTGMNQAIQRINDEIGLLAGIQKTADWEEWGAMTKSLGLDMKQGLALKDILTVYGEILEAATDLDLENMAVNTMFEHSAKIMEAKGLFLNNQQQLLKAQGLLQQDEILDATKQENYAKAVELVTGAIEGNIISTEEAMIALDAEIDDAALTILALAKSIDEAVQGHMDSAVMAMNKLPEAARITGKEYAENLIANISKVEKFDSGIKELIARGDILVAESIAKQGVQAQNVLTDLLANPWMSADMESRLAKVVDPAKALQAAEMAEEAKKVGTSISNGIVAGITEAAPAITETFEHVIEDAIHNVRDGYLKVENPSHTVAELIGKPMGEGIALGINESQSMVRRALLKTISNSIKGMKDDFGIYKTFTAAQRGIISAQQGLINSQHSLNKARRDAVSLTDRLSKAEKELAIAEVEGRAGVITVSEEIGLLRKKISLEKQIKTAGGNKSAREMLEIQKAEENIADLRAMHAKGVISNLELQAAEEELASMKGTDVTQDEQRLMILELAQAEKDLQKAREAAVEIDDNLVSLREEIISLKEEEELIDGRLAIAENNVASAKERVVDADLALASARAKLKEEIAWDSQFMTNMRALDSLYGGIATNIGLAASNTDTFLGKLEGQAGTISTYLDLIAGFSGVMKGLTIGEATKQGIMGSGEYNMFMQGLKQQFFGGGMAMGGRVKGYKHGGRGDPMTRALVGEYGPEEVRFVPGNGFLVKPLGTGSSGTVVNSLNVNVTGVPSDPISARKAALQISKALRKLDKEGSAGSGLRRN